ncbi:MAG: excinuclease ABC subunit UvrA, partial [Bacteroidota bacterium]
TLQKGFTRIYEDGDIRFIEDVLDESPLEERTTFYLLIDRVVVKSDDIGNLRGRLGDSVQTAYQEGHGTCEVEIIGKETRKFSEKFEADNINFEIPTVNFFSFNNPYGACPECEGFGRVLGIDEDLVIPDKGKSVYDNAVACWRGEVMSKYKESFISEAARKGFPVHKPYHELSDAQREMLWYGVEKAWGIYTFFEFLASKTHKIQYRVMLARYRGYTKCPECKGSRIRKDANYVKIDGYSISDLLFMQLDKLQETIENMEMDEYQQEVSVRLKREITTRLSYLNRVGVNYLTLNRKINSLSGGEMQRIRLATSLGSGLVGSMYILDEPSIGLHARDTDRLIQILESLRDQGNTVIVVEHDEGIMKKADQLIDIGPGAGELGGTIVFNGIYDKLVTEKTLTGEYLSGSKEIPIPQKRRKASSWVNLRGARMHNLNGVDVDIPLHAITVVTGVSGSGKSTLIQKVLYPALRKHTGEYGEKGGFLEELSGDLSLVRQVEMVDQSPVGRSARSNPATYLKAYDHIRDLLANQPLAKLKNLKPGNFSFNIDGGRCDTCKGEGYVTVEMQFLPDVKLLCETCNGKRFKKHVLEVKYEDKNVDDILNLTISEALAFFHNQPKIVKKLEVLDKVGLGYLRMGQSTSTLSGGEAQRMKLAFFLSQINDKGRDTFYIFDEPTTGLHFDDINKLMIAINELVERGNTVLIIEHNMDVIKCADWIIDIGPEGGDKGGNVMYQGVPEGLLKVKESHTAKYLEEKLG